MNSSTSSTKLSNPFQKTILGSLLQLPNYWQGLALGLLLAVIATVWSDSHQASAHGQPEAVKSLGALIAGAAGSLLPTAGRVIGRLAGGLVGTGARVGVNTLAGTAGGALRAIAPSGVRTLVNNPITRNLALGGIAAGGFSAVEHLLGGGGGGGSSQQLALPAGSAQQPIQVGQQFGDTFITRSWVTGVSHDGMPIIHGMLANGKRFATNKYGGIKVFRPKRNIVIGPDPRLSDASKVARAARKMDRAATRIAAINGKKLVRRS